MSTAHPVVTNQSRRAGKSPVPPEEEFWKRYSPHYEFPLSSVTSLGIHVLALVLLGIVAWYIAKYASDKDKPLQQIGVEVDPGGGGGNPQGAGGGPGGPNDGGPREDTGEKPKDDVPKPPTAPREQLNTEVPLLNVVPNTKDESVRELLQSANDAVKAQAKVHQKAREQMQSGLGEGGPGAGGGKDRGKDTGTGRETGPGKGNERLKRTLRWVMIFDTFNGADYRDQLAGLGAILAIPRDGERYMVIYNDELKGSRPVHGRMNEDLSKIKRIYWVDEKRESITPLCMALGIKPPMPNHVVAFFPKKLEDKLLQLELRFKGRKEDEIYETRFKVQKVGGGYEPVVIEQRAK